MICTTTVSLSGDMYCARLQTTAMKTPPPRKRVAQSPSRGPKGLGKYHPGGTHLTATRRLSDQHHDRRLQARGSCWCPCALTQFVESAGDERVCRVCVAHEFYAFNAFSALSKSVSYGNTESLEIPPPA